jgi:hypothetical protein
VCVCVCVCVCARARAALSYYICILIYVQPLTGSANLISKPSVPGYSIGHDTHRRASADVTHIPVAGLGMIGTNTDFAQRPQVSLRLIFIS